VVIYADNSATTQVRPEVLEAMLPFLQNEWGNASSIHSLGRKSNAAVERAREQVATLLNCQSEEVLFSSCGTQSNNVAIMGRARFVEANSRGKHLITTQIEHPAALGPAQHLESKGWKVTYLPVNREGLIDEDQLLDAIGPETSIISIIWANNEIGSVQPIEAIAKMAREREIFFHTDAVQIPGKLAIDAGGLAISSLALSGHKFYAPKGVGILYLKKGVNLMPIEFGGGQEGGLLPGTQAVANIVAIGKAAELAAVELKSNQEHLRQLQTDLLNALTRSDALKITGPKSLLERLPGHVSFVAPGLEGESIVMRCDLNNVCLSSGSACHNGVIEPSHVLKALGLSNREALGSVRISFGKYNSAEDCSQVQKVLLKAFDSSKLKQSKP
jgi:cysteine desulfurase